MDGEIYRLLGSRLISAKTIALKLKRKLDTHVYAALRRLCEGDTPLVVKIDDGYRRAK